MKLRAEESLVIAAIGIQSDLSIREIAAITKLRSNVYRHAVDSLFRKKLLFRRVVINLTQLGYAIWFSPQFRGSRIKDKLEKQLLANPNIGYIGEFEGEYPYKIEIYAREAPAIDATLNSVFAESRVSLGAREMSCNLSITDLGYKAFGPTLRQRTPLVIGQSSSQGHETIDTLDH